MQVELNVENNVFKLLLCGRYLIYGLIQRWWFYFRVDAAAAAVAVIAQILLPCNLITTELTLWSHTILTHSISLLISLCCDGDGTLIWALWLRTFWDPLQLPYLCIFPHCRYSIDWHFTTANMKDGEMAFGKSISLSAHLSLIRELAESMSSSLEILKRH